MPPAVVLVTGVSRYLGGRLAALLAADPAIERVIGVDTVPPPRELTAGPHRVRPRRHPQPAHRQGDRHRAQVDTVVHISVTATPLGRRRPRGDEGDQRHRHHAAARRLPEVAVGAAAGGQVDDRGLRLVLPRPGAVHRGAWSRGRCPAPATRKDAVEVEGYVRGFARRRPDVAVAVLRFANFIGPRHRQPADALLLAAGGADRARLRPAAAAPARGRRASRCCGWRRRRGPARHVQRRRRRACCCCPR